jgi:BlaI family transcriptional regulator, penicillinase repressor
VPVFDDLSKREREILSIVYRLGEATARDVEKALADGTSYSAVRTFLALLEAKGALTHRLDGKSYLWSPSTDPEKEGASLIAEATRTFFKGSRERAIAALIATDGRPLTAKEYAALSALIDAARRAGRPS